MTCETMRDETEHATKCANCPRPGEPRLHAVPNYGIDGGQLDPPPPFVLETVYLCDQCALIRGDVL